MVHPISSLIKNSRFAVEATGLIKHFGDNKAVDGVSLNIEAGCIYGVLGPNGAGKTTTISMLSTLLRPDGGHASVFGYDTVRDAHIVRQLIGLTGQYASVDEKLSATENLYLFSRLLGLSKKDARKKSADLLESFDLMEAAKRPLSKFSGGMRRRLDLAASLIAQPPLIFLDEPTTGLDPRTRLQMWDTIRQLVASGSTVLLTTQYLEEADQLADRIAVIDSGQVIAEGTPAELKASIGIAALELQLRSRDDAGTADDIIRQILGIDCHISPEGRITAPLADPDLITDILMAFRTHQIELVEVSVKSPTLDEVFMAITGKEKQKPINA
ncbi:ATP-binding cassette domain-containing protein [Taibaiella lutea]|uniref:ATP-binding cassette domain-containing protein n=1 Tax=Taibaiella lutea TaxID=2608001 RepID=A0A5M6CF08_9BACT|nr:ATP-binding cassette domain-containing protein [Taibaiella lutea]KAA5532492.1 ATP-binding cassette domain-containing protein [Taibaiella lutea]